MTQTQTQTQVAGSDRPAKPSSSKSHSKTRDLAPFFDSPRAFLELIHGHGEARGEIAWAQGRDETFKNRSPAPFGKVAEAFNDLKGKADVYLCLHRFWGWRRRVDHVGQLQAFHVDIDHYKAPTKRYRSLSPALAARAVLQCLDDQAIPAPSFILFSGKGLLAVWMIKPVPAGKKHKAGAIQRWNKIQVRLHQALHPLGADASQKHAAAVCRVPGTINSKYNTATRLLWIHPNGIEDRTLDDMAAELLPPRKSKKRSSSRQGTTSPPGSGRNHRNLHNERLHELRKWAMSQTEIEDGCRDWYLFCAACSLAWRVNPRQLENAILAFARDTGLLDISGWTRHRVLEVTGTVIRRAHEGASGSAPEWGQGRYLLTSRAILDQLPITAADARALGLIHLNPCPIQKARHRKTADRERQQRRRRASGQKSRDDYEADSRSRQKPWEALGIARSTWYRKGMHKTPAPEPTSDAVPGEPEEQSQKIA